MSRTPTFPLTRAVTINAGTADPRTFSSNPCGVAPPGRSPGSVSSLGTKTKAVVVAYTSTKKVAIGCLTNHDPICEISVPAACSVCPAMIGASSQQSNHQAAPPLRRRPTSRALTSAFLPGRRHAIWEDVRDVVADGLTAWVWQRQTRARKPGARISVADQPPNWASHGVPRAACPRRQAPHQRILRGRPEIRWQATRDVQQARDRSDGPAGLLMLRPRRPRFWLRPGPAPPDRGDSWSWQGSDWHRRSHCQCLGLPVPAPVRALA